MKTIAFKESLLVIFKILELFAKTLTADDKYSLLNRDNLSQPIKIYFYIRIKNFVTYLSAFLKFRLHFEQFEIKDGPYS